jgi:cystathionine beta-lyase
MTEPTRQVLPLNWQEPMEERHLAEVQRQFFLQAIDRRHTFSEKLALGEQLQGPADSIPMWVADMDLPAPPFLLEALKARLQHPIFGYHLMPEAAREAIITWQAAYGYSVKASDIQFTPSVLNGLHLAIQTVSQSGDQLLTMPPVYPPFLQAAAHCGRTCRFLPLNCEQDARGSLKYSMDFEGLERMFTRHPIKALLFCHPHNPVGRSWGKEELETLSQLCLRHRVAMISDEIHSDLVFQGTHHPLASLSPEVAQQTITLNSPSKSFNLGGLQVGYALIANPAWQQRFALARQRVALPEWNTFALHALLAAYSGAGKNWCMALLHHLRGNRQLLEDCLADLASEVKLSPMQATYLTWLDCSAWQWTSMELHQWFLHEAKLLLSDGASFYPPHTQKGAQLRMNLAVSRQTMHQALDHLRRALIHRPAHPFKSAAKGKGFPHEP